MRRGLPQIEDASTLSLGEFSNDQCLLISEVLILLENKKQLNDKQSAAFQKSLDHCQLFSKFNSETIREVRHLFHTEQFENFEVAQLGNLLVESPEEAKSVIPSLSRFGEDHLGQVLGELLTLKRFQ